MSDQDTGRIRQRPIGPAQELRSLHQLMAGSILDRLARGEHGRLKRRRDRTAHLSDALKRHPPARNLFARSRNWHFRAVHIRGHRRHWCRCDAQWCHRHGGRLARKAQRRNGEKKKAKYTSHRLLRLSQGAEKSMRDKSRGRHPRSWANVLAKIQTRLQRGYVVSRRNPTAGATAM